jgi:NAD(P)-dependent dehydrogenase (short-subunit alcohol dehydrogenase family)
MRLYRLVHIRTSAQARGICTSWTTPVRTCRISSRPSSKHIPMSRCAARRPPVPIYRRMRQVTVIQADAADEAAIKGICERATQEEGRLDIFFANVRTVVSLHVRDALTLRSPASVQAGIATGTALQDTTTQQFSEVMRINALSCFLAIKHASAEMKRANAARGKEFGGGSIVLTASGASGSVPLGAPCRSTAVPCQSRASVRAQAPSIVSLR